MIAKEVFSGLLRFLAKVPVTILLLSACFVSLILLLSPNSMMEFLGLQNIRSFHRSTIGLLLLVSTIILLLQLVSWLTGLIRGWFAYSGRDARRRLESVGEWNQALIRQLYEDPSHAQKLPLQSANVQALISVNVLYRSCIGDAIGFDCALQPWVIQYLDLHPEFVSKMMRFKTPYTVGAFF